MQVKRTVMVLDGDARARSKIVETLTNKGYAVEAVGSGREAVEKARASAAACAIVDVALEDMSGLEAVDLLRSLDPRLHIIMTAGRNTKELEAEVRKRDVVYYYVKEFDIEELVQAVGRAAGGGHMQRGKRILVVDDDSDYQAAIKRILEDAGYEVVQAYTKEQGLAALKKQRADLIILDIMMTRSTDGFQFLYEVRSNGELEKPPVLSVSCISDATGFGFSPTEDNGYFPVDDFLSKPVEPAVLLARVEALLGGERPAQRGV